MLRRATLINEIISKLTSLQSYTETTNQVNLTDHAIHLEEFFRDMINMLFGYKLVNANFSKQNHPVVDLIDPNERLAIQVTTKKNLRDVRAIVGRFHAAGLHHSYDRLIILAPMNQHRKREHDVIIESFAFSPSSDFWDLSYLVRAIKDAEFSRIEKIATYIESNFNQSGATSGVVRSNIVQHVEGDGITIVQTIGI